MQVCCFLLSALLTLQESEAGARFGGGRAMGQQRSSLPLGARSSAHPNPSSPAPTAGPMNSASSAQAASPATPLKTSTPAQTAAPVPSTSWGGGWVGRMLMGAAVGVGVMSLAHAFGLGQEDAQGMMSLLLLILMGTCLYLAWTLWIRWRTRSQVQRFGVGMSGRAGMQPTSGAIGSMYNPKNVGNDASARPWETGNVAHVDSSKGLDLAQKAILKPFEPQQLGSWESGLHEVDESQQAVPDVEAFKTMAKEQFLNLQDAWDHLDLNRLASFLSPDMFALVKAQFAERTTGPQKTEVMMLQAQWLGIEQVQGQSIASVELSGMSREAQEASFTPFREIWSWTRPVAIEHSSWLVCGLEPLQ